MFKSMKLSIVNKVPQSGKYCFPVSEMTLTVVSWRTTLDLCPNGKARIMSQWPSHRSMLFISKTNLTKMETFDSREHFSTWDHIYLFRGH